MKITWNALTLTVTVNRNALDCYNLVGHECPGMGGFRVDAGFAENTTLTMRIHFGAGRKTMIVDCDLYQNETLVADIFGYEYIRRFYEECVNH